MRKIIYFLGIICLLFCLSSCTFSSEQETVTTTTIEDTTTSSQTKRKTYHVAFYSENILIHEYEAYPSTVLVFAGTKPVKKSDDANYYVFLGFDINEDGAVDFDLSNIIKVTEDIEAHAVFESVKKEYKVTFYDLDGQAEFEMKAHYGDQVTYTLNKQTKKDSIYEYDFNGWDSDLICNGDMEIYPLIAKKENVYTISFYNGEELFLTKQMTYFDTLTITSPTKDAIVSGYYSFSSWQTNDKKIIDTLTNVTKDMTFYAVYKFTSYEYTVVYKKCMCEVIKPQKNLKGKKYTKKKKNLEKEKDDDYVYYFDSWDNDGVNITQDTVINPLYTKYEREKIFTFTVAFGTVSISGLIDKTRSAYEIPQYVEGKKVTAISNNAFKNCTNMESVTFPEGLQYIGSSSFESTKISSVSFPLTLLSVESNAFKNTLITSITLPKNICFFAFDSFYPNKDKGHINVTIDENNSYFTQTGRYILEKDKLCYISGSSFLAEEIPSSVKIIDDYVFAYLNGSVNFGGQVTKIGDYAFYYYSHYRTTQNIVFSDTLEEIGDYAFAYSTLSAIINFPDSLKTIGSYAFYNVKGVTKVNTGSLLESILDYAFAEEPSLTQIDFSKSVNLKTIGKYALSRIPLIEEIAFSSQTLSLDEYSISYNDKLKSVSFVEGMKVLANYGIVNNKVLEEVILSSTLEVIGSYALSNNASLDTLTIPSGLIFISHHAFTGSKVSSLVMPSTLVYIGAYAFQNTSLTSITLPVKTTKWKGNQRCVQVVGDCQIDGKTYYYYSSYGTNSATFSYNATTDAQSLTTTYVDCAYIKDVINYYSEKVIATDDDARPLTNFNYEDYLWIKK